MGIQYRLPDNTITVGKGLALYVHIPFCAKRCPYCAFYKLIWSDQDERRFVEALIREMNEYSVAYGRLRVRSVFWGGGTPSTLSGWAITDIADAIRLYFDLDPDVEWTIEANPESLTTERIRLFAAAGVNRVSIGIQSFLTKELAILGRSQTQSSMHGLLDRIRQEGVSNINLDFMYGLPGQQFENLMESIEMALSESPTHISTYALSIEPGTIYAKTGVSTADEGLQLKMYRGIRQRLLTHGFRQYEVSAFAKKGKESQHNLAYWRYTPYIGLGPSASSFFQGIAYQQVSSLDRYCVDPRPPVLKGIPPLDEDTLASHFLIANLRRVEGVTNLQIRDGLGRARWGPDDPRVMAFKRDRLLRNRPDRLQLTRRGVELMNVVLEGLI